MPTQEKKDLIVLEKHQLVDVLDNWDIEELTTDEQRIVIRSMCYYDIEYFAQNITTRWTSDKMTGKRYNTPDFHKQLWEIAKSRKDFLCIVPRGFAKTTAVSKICVLWKLLFKFETSIMLIMTKGLGEEVVGDIRRELETNEMIMSIWGHLVPNNNKEEKVNEKWRQRQLQLLNGTELKTITKGEAIRGNRPTWILVDDPQENKDVKNPIMADEFWNWIFTAVYPSLNPGGSMGTLGTVISSNCFVNKLKQEAAQRGVEVVEFPAILNFNLEKFTGTSLWPERWPLEALKRMFEKMTEEPFMQEYMNKPLVLNGSPVFSKEIIASLKQQESEEIYEMTKFFIKKELLKTKAVFIGVDLASGNQDGDYTTITGRLKDFTLAFQFRQKVTEDRAAAVTDKLVALCNDFFIVNERNNTCGGSYLYAVKQYPWRYKLYKEKGFDHVSLKETDHYGFNTNVSSKPLIIDNFRQVLERGGFQVSQEEYEELQYYYYDETSTNALPPYHDDTVISDALCVFGITRFSAMANDKKEKPVETKITRWEKYKLQHDGKQSLTI